jgi:hypothetical protein
MPNDDKWSVGRINKFPLRRWSRCWGRFALWCDRLTGACRAHPGPGSRRASSRRSIVTHRACLDYGRSIFDVVEGRDRPSDVVAWLGTNGFKVLNVAGSRESRAPGIGERAEAYLVAVFRRLVEPGA